MDYHLLLYFLFVYQMNSASLCTFPVPSDGQIIAILLLKLLAVCSWYDIAYQVHREAHGALLVYFRDSTLSFAAHSLPCSCGACFL
jgi:hypothetical protein